MKDQDSNGSEPGDEIPAPPTPEGATGEEKLPSLINRISYSFRVSIAAVWALSLLVLLAINRLPSPKSTTTQAAAARLGDFLQARNSADTAIRQAEALLADIASPQVQVLAFEGLQRLGAVEKWNAGEDSASDLAGAVNDFRTGLRTLAERATFVYSMGAGQSPTLTEAWKEMLEGQKAGVRASALRLDRTMRRVEERLALRAVDESKIQRRRIAHANWLLFLTLIGIVGTTGFMIWQQPRDLERTFRRLRALLARPDAGVGVVPPIPEGFRFKEFRDLGRAIHFYMERMEAFDESKTKEVDGIHRRLVVLGRITNDLILFCSPEGRVTFANDSLLDLLELPSEEVVGKMIFELPMPETILAVLRNCVRDPRRLDDVAVMWHRKDGSDTAFLLDLAAVRDDAGRLRELTFLFHPSEEEEI